MGNEKIVVYIRKGSREGERVFSFKRPERIPVSILLENLLAIDGNQVIGAVTEYFDNDDNEFKYVGPFHKDRWMEVSNLPEGLVLLEVKLIDFLQEYDYDVEFA